MQFVNTGLENYISTEKIIAVFSNNSAPIKNLIKVAKENSRCVDLTFGRKCKCVILTTSNHVILGSFKPKTVAAKIYPDLLLQDDEDDE